MENTATSTGLRASAASHAGGKRTWLIASTMIVRSKARARLGGPIPGKRASTQNAMALAPVRNRMLNSWTLTRSLCLRSWQSYRFVAAGPEVQTHSDRSDSLGWYAHLKSTGSTLPAIVLAAAVASFAGTIGPDARWLPALGRTILRVAALPHGVPYASASSRGWHNVPVLAELTFYGLQSSFGARGLLGAQIVAVALLVVLIARDARRLGATDAGIAATLVVLVVAGLLALAGIHAQLFSLVLFPALVSLLRAEERSPSARIWVLVPLLALWSNLHGVALLGLGIALLYLLGHRARRRPLESAGVAVASLLALCATPTPLGTPSYYAGVMTSEAAREGYGLWAPLSLHSGFDVLLVGGAAILFVGFAFARPRFWQLVGAAALAVATVHAARNGIWLLMFLAAPAATVLPIARRPRPALSHCVALVLAAGAVAGFVRGPLELGASPRLIARAISEAHGRPILAEPAAAEQIAQAGGRVWISNPLDAFRSADQRLYLDWLRGRPSCDRALRNETDVVVLDGSPADLRLIKDRRFYQAYSDGRFRLFVVRSSES
jgi:hypothetical protein